MNPHAMIESDVDMSEFDAMVLQSGLLCNQLLVALCMVTMMVVAHAAIVLEQCDKPHPQI
jgi:hypothetical protein